MHLSMDPLAQKAPLLATNIVTQLATPDTHHYIYATKIAIRRRCGLLSGTRPLQAT